MKLILQKPSEAHTSEIRAYRDECLAHDTHTHGDSGLDKHEDITAWINFCCLMAHKETIPKPGWVQASQFMLMEEGSPRILGMINLRHYLNGGYLAEHGGHIGYGVRPSERGKGYAKAMLLLCLEECRKLGLEEVLVICDIDNHASRGVIKACGGVFERLAITGGEIDERYWINLDSNSKPLAYFSDGSQSFSRSALKETAIDQNSILPNYYGGYDEDGRLATRHGLVEFLTTMRYIEKYLPKGGKVLEVGAGTGRYSRAVADMGYTVEAVELVPHNIDIFRQSMKPGREINITQGNALDLSMFESDTFDLVLVLGPLYHLYTLEDKRQAISEALRVTKPGGVVFVAYVMSDPSIAEGGFGQKRYEVGELIQRGLIDPLTFATTSKPEDIFELVRIEDINALMDTFPVNRLHLVATDLFSRYIMDSLKAMDDECFALYLRYHFAVCERQDMIGISHHVLDIFRTNKTKDQTNPS